MGTFHVLYAQVFTHKWLSGDDTQGPATTCCTSLVVDFDLV
jgi:hypothetical protein